MTPLTTFPASLQHLILHGGDGLPPAYGPLLHADPTDWSRVNAGTWAWSPEEGHALRPDRAGRRVLDSADRWALTLDGPSPLPWLDRLALVTTWMLDGRIGGCAVVYRHDIYRIWVEWCAPAFGVWSVTWKVSGEVERATYGDGSPRAGVPSLPTLPLHLAKHRAEVALLRALYDVPEVAFRVAAAASRASNPS